MIVVVLIERGLLPGLKRDELAHRLVGRNPGAAAHRPAGTVLHLEGESLAMAFRLGEFDEVRPLRAQARDRLGDARPERSVRMSVEELDPADSGGLDRGDIRRESLLRRIPADDVKPRLRRAIIRPRDSCANHRTHACKAPKYPNHFPIPPSCYPWPIMARPYDKMDTPHPPCDRYKGATTTQSGFSTSTVGAPLCDR